MQCENCFEVLGDEVLLNARRMSEQIERPPLETFLAGQLAAVRRVEIIARFHLLVSTKQTLQHASTLCAYYEQWNSLKGRVLACFWLVGWFLFHFAHSNGMTTQ